MSGWDGALALGEPVAVARALAALPAGELQRAAAHPARKRSALRVLGLADGGLLGAALQALEPIRIDLRPPERWSLADTLGTLKRAVDGDLEAAVLARVGGYARRLSAIVPAGRTTGAFVRLALETWDAGSLDRAGRRDWRALLRDLVDDRELDLAAAAVSFLKADAVARDALADSAELSERLGAALAADGRDAEAVQPWLDASEAWLAARRNRQAVSALRQARRSVGANRAALARVQLQHAEIALRTGDMVGAVKSWRALQKVRGEAPDVAARAAWALARLARASRQTVAERRALKAALRCGKEARDPALVERAAVALVRRLAADGLDDAVGAVQREVGPDPLYAAVVAALPDG